MLPGFRLADEDDLSRRKHWHCLRLSQNCGHVVLLGGKIPNAPITRAFGDVRVDKFLTAQLLQIPVRANQEDSRNWFSFCEAGQQFLRGDRSHQKFSRTSETRRDAKSRDIRSSAGPCSSKNLDASVEISYGSRKREAAFLLKNFFFSPSFLSKFVVDFVDYFFRLPLFQ